MSGKLAIFDSFNNQFVRFIQTESAGGIVLVLAAAMVIKNYPLTKFYSGFLNIEGEIRLGSLSVEKLLFL